jgi:hypothetical protein
MLDERGRTNKRVLWIANKQFNAWKLGKETEWRIKTGLKYIWHYPKENSVGRICKQIKEKCNDIERRKLFANIREKTALIFYCGMKFERAFEKGWCPVCRKEEDALRILLKCSQTKKWRKQFLSGKWFIVNEEEVAYKWIICFTNAVELRNIEKHLYRFR